MTVATVDAKMCILLKEKHQPDEILQSFRLKKININNIWLQNEAGRKNTAFGGEYDKYHNI